MCRYLAGGYGTPATAETVPGLEGQAARHGDPRLAGRRRGTSMYHEVGGFWQWTIITNFDIRVMGTVALLGEGYRDLARLADCNPSVVGVQPCPGNDPALRGELRLRVRF